MRVALLSSVLITEGSFQCFEPFDIVRTLFDKRLREKSFNPCHIISREVYVTGELAIARLRLFRENREIVPGGYRETVKDRKRVLPQHLRIHLKFVALSFGSTVSFGFRGLTWSRP